MSAPQSLLQETFDQLKQRRWAQAKTTAPERRARLIRLRDAILAAKQDIQQAIYQDLRRAPTETELLEITPTLGEIGFLIENLERLMTPKAVGTPLSLMPSRSELRLEPKGMVLVLSPWNYPFYLCAVPLAGAVAAGNCVVVKPSEVAPATSAMIAKVFGEVFDAREVRVVEGDASVSKALLELPFDHFFYTGGGPVGRIVMEAAARHLSSVTLELGGKSPVFIHESVNDWARTGERIAWGKWTNAGQTCVAPDTVLVPRALERKLVESLLRAVSRFYGVTEESRHRSPDFARLINERHYRRVRKLVEDSIAAGARLECGGKFDDSERYIAPTVLTGVRPEHPILQEEIFGPVLPVVAYDRVEEAITWVQGRDKPLALYVFSENEAFVERILSETSAGGTTINDVSIHLANPHLPFGGVGPSGLGRYHGEFGFREFSHERAVFVQSRLSPVRWLQPPYTARVKKFVSLVQKII